MLQEQQTALVSTAFSPVVRESLDLACAIFDSRGEMVGQSTGGTPGHINAMATGMRHFVERFPPGRLRDGDVLITNDPWMTAGQINDLTIATPVYRDGRLVAWFASAATPRTSAAGSCRPRRPRCSRRGCGCRSCGCAPPRDPTRCSSS